MVGRQARLQSDFYRDNYRKLMKGLIIFVAIMLILIAMIIYLVFFRPTPPFFATTTTGQIISMVPVKQ